MGLARTRAVSLTGVQGELVEIECDIASGLPGLSFTGLPDASVMESRDRLRAALHNCGIEWPNRRITVALLPADVRKVGSRYDLAVAMAVLAAAGTVPAAAVADTAWIGELGLDGALRPVRGALPSVLAARRCGVRRVVVASANAHEAALVDGIEVRSAERLVEVIDFLTGSGPALPAAEPTRGTPASAVGGPDLADVAGQVAGKRALEIAAAGGHHLFLIGAPGAGKTMLAERLPGLLPVLDDRAALEVTAVHSVVGLLRHNPELVRRPPMQAPHHTASIAALVGGGSNIARPGAISLAHHGVLFLDEAPEFSTSALDALRQPIESGEVVLHRQGGAVRYPARFQLVLAANPCACARRPADCECPPHVRRRHQQRLSGPFLDRIDLRVQVEPVLHADLFDDGSQREASAVVAARVADARSAAALRWADVGHRTNGTVPGPVLRSARWRPPPSVTRSLESFLERGTISARGFDRVLRLAWTLGDLAGRDRPVAEDLGEAIYFRTGQVESWAA
ncbi:YifB family Mg chelatase-like AAA ATPase [uncultured Jatrophihabitans sp.]|uniref:YifB family Mg chelatase-like AAA ATPase n=1 Tax=uncultured Jatrophihabitans sp. TaxID=1610747 RepID=UPI0035CB520B